MLQYMRNGGFPMWVMLIAAIGAVVLAFTRDRRDRSSVLFGGAFLAIVLGFGGMSLGMVMVSTHYEGPNHAAVIAAGLGEIANDGTFGAGLALALGIAGIVARERRTANA
jgi:hypothetical protein